MIDREKREKVIKGLECHVNGHPHTRCHKCPYWGTSPHGSSECNVLAADALALLKAQEPVLYGHWTTKRTELHDGEWYCSNCDMEPSVFEETPFCPYCGARMDVVAPTCGPDYCDV